MSITALDKWVSSNIGPPVVSDGAVTLDSWAGSGLSAPYFATPAIDYGTLDRWVSSSQSPPTIVADASDLSYLFLYFPTGTTPTPFWLYGSAMRRNRN